MIDVAGLRKRYGSLTAVDDVSFHVPAGAAVALWGSNGAGKTTVIRCVLGLIPFRGCVRVAGRHVRREGKLARRTIGYVPQEFALYEDLRLGEALHYFARLKRAGSVDDTAALAEVGLAGLRRRRIGELSGGMKQRMALAVALLADPPVLVLDELTSNLDAAAQHGFLDLLLALKGRGKTLLFTSHHLDEVRTLADRALVMRQGRLCGDCPPEALAETLGARCLVHVVLEERQVGSALAVLARQGFDASPNGCGIHVRVAPGANAAPILALDRAAITVRRFDLFDQFQEEGPGDERSHCAR